MSDFGLEPEAPALSQEPGIDLRPAGRISLAITALALLGAMIFAMAKRGPWYDEFYTFYVTSPTFGFRTALVDHWLIDNHPPLFYALVRAMRWLGPTIETQRAINILVGFIAFGCGVMVVRSSPKTERLAIFYFLFLAAQLGAIFHGAELRSYFLSLCSAALLVVTLSTAYLDGKASNCWWRWTLAGAIFLSLNTHLATTVISAAILASFLIAFVAQRNAQLLWSVLPSTLLSGAMFIAVTAIQLPLWDTNTQPFWISPGVKAAVRTTVWTATQAATANPIILVLGAFGIGLMLVEAIRGRQGNRELGLITILVAGGTLAIAMILALHIWRPIVIPPILIGLIPALAMMLAIGIQHVLHQTNERLAALLVILATGASLVAIGFNLRTTIAYPSWEGTASLIGQQVGRCPTTVVHIDPNFWNAGTLTLQPADNAAVIPMAYQMMAQRFGFAIEPSESRRVSVNCPTLFWVEHYRGPPIRPAPIFFHVRKQGFQVSGLAVYSTGWGWIASTSRLDAGSVEKN